MHASAVLSAASPSVAGPAVRAPIPALHLALVLLGFPAVSALLSTLLLDRTVFDATGLDFFTVFWGLIAAWYALQIVVLGRVLRASGWTWADIGHRWDRRRTLQACAAYLAVAAVLLGLIEAALAQAEPTPERLRMLSDLADLTPQTTVQRIVFIVMGLFAGLAEELVYRGFAISALRRRGLHAALAVPLAALPFVFQHGLKSIAQFGWFFGWGLAFGLLFVATRRLAPGLVLHWLVILAALPAVLQALR